MKLNQVVLALKREKELLEQIRVLAECQMELLQSGRAGDMEALLPLRRGPMSELAATEEAITNEIRQMWNDCTVGVDTLDEFESLNFEILSLADRIVDLDEKAEQLAEQYDDCTSSEPPARTEAY